MFKLHRLVLLALISSAFFVQNASAEVGFCDSADSTQCNWLEDKWGGSGDGNGGGSGGPTYYQCAAKGGTGARCKICQSRTQLNGTTYTWCGDAAFDASCSCSVSTGRCESKDSCLYIKP